jgi:hypothetical protein
MPICAGASDEIQSKHSSIGISPVSGIQLWQAASGSSYIDAIVLNFTNGDVRSLGDVDVLRKLANKELGTLYRLSSLTLAPTDRVVKAYVWAGDEEARVKGLAITLKSGARLYGANGNSVLDTAALAMTDSAALGTGILLGLTAAAQPDTERLAALGLSFLKAAPVSVGVAVDMPQIDLNRVVFKPSKTVETSIISSGDTTRGSCAAFSTKLTTRVGYSDADKAKRMRDTLFGWAGVAYKKQQFQLQASLEATGSQAIEGSPDAAVVTWSSPVGQLCTDPSHRHLAMPCLPWAPAIDCNPTSP